MPSPTPPRSQLDQNPRIRLNRRHALIAAGGVFGALAIGATAKNVYDQIREQDPTQVVNSLKRAGFTDFSASIGTPQTLIIFHLDSPRSMIGLNQQIREVASIVEGKRDISMIAIYDPLTFSDVAPVAIDREQFKLKTGFLPPPLNVAEVQNRKSALELLFHELRLSGNANPPVIYFSPLGPNESPTPEGVDALFATRLFIHMSEVMTPAKRKILLDSNSTFERDMDRFTDQAISRIVSRLKTFGIEIKLSSEDYLFSKMDPNNPQAEEKLDGLVVLAAQLTAIYQNSLRQNSKGGTNFSKHVNRSLNAPRFSGQPPATIVIIPEDVTITLGADKPTILDFKSKKKIDPTSLI